VEWEWNDLAARGSKKDSSTSQTASFAGAKEEEKLGRLRPE